VAVDDHGGYGLVSVGDRAHERGRVLPDVDLVDSQVMPTQNQAQPHAEHAAWPPVERDHGPGLGLIDRFAHDYRQPQQPMLDVGVNEGLVISGCRRVLPREGGPVERSAYGRPSIATPTRP